MYNPVDEAKVLQILSEPSGNLYLDHTCHYPPLLSDYSFDSTILRMVDHYNLLTSHNNKLLDRFRVINKEEGLTLKLVPNSLSRLLATLNSVMGDSKEFKSTWITNLVTVFNFKEGSMYLLNDKFHRASAHGVFVGIKYTNKDTGHITTLFEQVYGAVKVTQAEKIHDVQFVQ